MRILMLYDFSSSYRIMNISTRDSGDYPHGSVNDVAITYKESGYPVHTDLTCSWGMEVNLIITDFDCTSNLLVRGSHDNLK